MASGETRYQTRFEYPELLEKGRNNVVVCPVYADGALVTPSSGTLTVYNRSGNSVATPSVSITGDIATATITSADLSAESYDEHWRLSWSLTIGGVAYTFENTGALVRKALYPCISDVDLLRRHPDLTDLLPDTNTGHQDVIDEAFAELQNMLWERGNRPHLIATATSFRRWLVFKALELRFLGFYQHAGDRSYLETANLYEEKAEQAWERISWQYDIDQDGVVEDGTERKHAAHPLFIGSRGPRRGW